MEDAEVDGVGHGGVACVFGMKMVAAVVLWRESEGMVTIDRGFVEIDGSVEDATCTNPRVDGLANLLALFCGITSTLVWGDGGGEDLDTVLVRASRKLAQALFHILCCEVVVRQIWFVESADVIDTLKHDHIADAGLRDNIAIEARQGTGTYSIDEDAIAADAFVQDGEIPGGRVVVQAGGKNVGPAVVQIVGGASSIGNGISEGHNRCCLRRDGLDIDAFEEKPGRDGGGSSEVRSADFVPGLDVVGLLSAGVDGDVADLLERQEEADGQVREGRCWELDDVAECFCAGGNNDGRIATKGDGVERAGLNGGFTGTKGDAGGIDTKRLSTELVCEVDAQCFAGDRSMDDLADGGTDESGNLVPRIASEGRCSPSTDPLHVGDGCWTGAGLSGCGEAEQCSKSE